MRLAVGKIDRQSPVMMTKAIDINFNPYWTVPVLNHPQGILIPRMQKDANYLSDHKIRIFNKSGEEVEASPDRLEFAGRGQLQIPARTRAATSIPSASSASTSTIPTGVYMHDTPEKGVFGMTSDSYRPAASGCRTCATM